MKHGTSDSPSAVMDWLRSEASGLWPAILGSLSLRRSPCIRADCPACLSGEQHQSYVLYGRVSGRRIAVYVPEELVPEVQRCVDNGRALQELLLQAVSDFLDDQHAMIERVRRDLVRGLKKPGSGRGGLTPQQVLRSLVLMRVKNWDYRELRERIAD